LAQAVTAHGARRPAILMCSSPGKAGSESTPWHDVFDLDSGHVRHFGDHKPSSKEPATHHVHVPASVLDDPARRRAARAALEQALAGMH
jgi:hypothetical protein